MVTPWKKSEDIEGTTISTIAKRSSQGVILAKVSCQSACLSVVGISREMYIHPHPPLYDIHLQFFLQHTLYDVRGHILFCHASGTGAQDIPHPQGVSEEFVRKVCAHVSGPNQTMSCFCCLVRAPLNQLTGKWSCEGERAWKLASQSCASTLPSRGSFCRGSCFGRS